MDLQIKLVSDGNAIECVSPEVPSLPAWAVWKNQAYGTTYEPIAIVYNKRLLTGDEIPQSHADLMRVFKEKAEKIKGKVTTRPYGRRQSPEDAARHLDVPRRPLGVPVPSP